MTNQTVLFNDTDIAQGLRQMRQAALELLQAQMDEVPEEGWSILPVDMQPLFASFSPLQVDPDYRLAAYILRNGRESESRVWALPEAESLPSLIDRAAEPARPPRALPDPMQAIQGDGSPLSYLAASILARELVEFAAFGHARQWGSDAILVTGAEAGWEDEGDDDDADAGIAQLDRGEWDDVAWEWLIPVPQSLAPLVYRRGQRHVVEFYTVTGLGGNRIVRYVDTYPGPGYSFSSQSVVVAIADGGFVV